MRSGKKSRSSKTVATSARTRADVSSYALPAKVTVPPLGFSTPVTHRSSVLLPEPLWPTTASERPASTAKDTSSKTTFVPYVWDRPSTWSRVSLGMSARYPAFLGARPGAKACR